MSDSHSTTPAPSGKPAKPYADFPLFAHDSGQWAKKIRGKMHYFGKWEDPDAALKSYLAQKDDLHSGRTPRPDRDALTVKELANRFLNEKQALVERGELAALTWGDYKTACLEVLAAFGKSRLVADLRPEDFSALRKRLAAKWGPHRLNKTIQFVRCIFKFAFDADLLEHPIRFGPGFKRASKKVLRLHRAEQGPKLFTADEVRRMIDAAALPLRAMILLGINCAFGNSDCGNLPLSAVDLDAGMIDYPRPKTGIARRCPLWPETMVALRDALQKRPAPKKEEHAGLVFLTRCGDSWHTGTPDGPLSRETGKLLRRLGINGRDRLGFYTLRHTFRTVADASKDQPAVDFMMGHEVPHMSAVYRQTIADERLRAVADYVRKWLFNETTATSPHTDFQQSPSLILSEQERQLRNAQYGMPRANYQQVVLASRLMKKGWTDPYYYRGCVWLSSPACRHNRQSRRMRACSIRPIRITKTGHILRGW